MRTDYVAPSSRKCRRILGTLLTSGKPVRVTLENGYLMFHTHYSRDEPARLALKDAYAIASGNGLIKLLTLISSTHP